MQGNLQVRFLGEGDGSNAIPLPGESGTPPHTAAPSHSPPPVVVTPPKGDTYLSGGDIDQRLIAWITDEFQKDQGIDLSKDKMALQRLKEAAQKAKIELSSLMETQINLPFITADQKGAKHLVMKLTRAKFDSLIDDLLKRTLEPRTQVLKDDGLTPVAHVESHNFIEDLNGVPLEMVYIPAGKFIMGSNDNDSEKPPHEVSVPAFFMSKFQITQAQWKVVMGTNPSQFTGDDLLPVEKISWDHAKEFCKKLLQLTNKAYRLPSESEWEYACRAGTTGDYAGDLEKMAWYAGNSGRKTHPVGRKEPNAFGLYDMHGNVWEWCEDARHVNYNGAPADGSAWLSEGDSTFKVLRGGSYGDNGGLCRSAYRLRNVAGLHNDYIGFRVCVSAGIG